MLLSRSVLKKQLEWTNCCFRAAILEVYSPYLTQKQKRLHLTSLKTLIELEYPHEPYPPEVHRAYMRHVLAMSTRRLEIVLAAFQQDKQYRKQETIDAIMTELFERSVSETKDANR
jgi:hypothetical protein